MTREAVHNPGPRIEGHYRSSERSFHVPEHVVHHAWQQGSQKHIAAHHTNDSAKHHLPHADHVISGLHRHGQQHGTDHGKSAKGDSKHKHAKAETERTASDGQWHTARMSQYSDHNNSSGAGVNNSCSGEHQLANLHLSFGARVEVRRPGDKSGHTDVGVVRDRGPFVRGRQFDDRGSCISKALGFGHGVPKVEYRVINS
jgi:hypothetical protein